MDAKTAETREEIIGRIKPSECMYCESKHITFEAVHFPRFFFSCQTCEMRTELVYNWHTKQAEVG